MGKNKVTVELGTLSRDAVDVIYEALKAAGLRNFRVQSDTRGRGTPGTLDTVASDPKDKSDVFARRTTCGISCVELEHHSKGCDERLQNRMGKAGRRKPFEPRYLAAAMVKRDHRESCTSECMVLQCVGGRRAGMDIWICKGIEHSLACDKTYNTKVYADAVWDNVGPGKRKRPFQDEDKCSRNPNIRDFRRTTCTAKCMVMQRWDAIQWVYTGIKHHESCMPQSTVKARGSEADRQLEGGGRRNAGLRGRA